MKISQKIAMGKYKNVSDKHRCLLINEPYFWIKTSHLCWNIWNSGNKIMGIRSSHALCGRIKRALLPQLYPWSNEQGGKPPPLPHSLRTPRSGNLKFIVLYSMSSPGIWSSWSRQRVRESCLEDKRNRD